MTKKIPETIMIEAINICLNETLKDESVEILDSEFDSKTRTFNCKVNNPNKVNVDKISNVLLSKLRDELINQLQKNNLNIKEYRIETINIVSLNGDTLYVQMV